MKSVTGMSIISLLGLLGFLLFTSGCEYYAEGDVTAPDQGWPTYGLTNFYSEGVDDSGNMWVAITGNFSDYGNNVQVSCDGNYVNSEVMTQSETQLEVSIPAGQYQECDFSVNTNDGYDLGAVSGSLTAMDINGSSMRQNSNPNYIDVTLTGDFSVQPLMRSLLSVSASCAGEATSYPQIISSSTNAITIAVPNPNYNSNDHFSKCNFAVLDSFQGAYGNTVTVSSPAYFLAVQGM